MSAMESTVQSSTFCGVIDFGVSWPLNSESWSESEVCDCGVGCWAVFLRVGDCESRISSRVENRIIDFDGVPSSPDLLLATGDPLGVRLLLAGADVAVASDKEEGLGPLLAFTCCGAEFRA